MLDLRRYSDQVREWPSSGRHILAQFDSESIVVYQAYRPALAQFTVKHQFFGGGFSYSRMSWIKPNFLWMMFRSGWAQKEGQEQILAIRLKRSFFDEILTASVASTFSASGFESHEQWNAALADSNVRLQWDPDHDPAGNCVDRRAVQLGLKGSMLERFGKTEIVSIENVTSFVLEQRRNLQKPYARLLIPAESVYQPSEQAANSVGVDPMPDFQ